MTTDTGTPAPAPAPAVPVADPAALAQLALRVGVFHNRARRATDDYNAVKRAAELAFAPIRRRGVPNQEIILPDGTKVALISITKGGVFVDTDEDALTLVIAGNEPDGFEDYVLHQAFTDPRVVRLLAEHLPDLVERRVRSDVRARYQAELEENGGRVVDRGTGERVEVATITNLEASGHYSVTWTSKGQLLLQEAVDAGLVNLDGTSPDPDPEPDPEPDPPAAAAPAAPDDADARIGRALNRGTTSPGFAPTGEQAAVLAAVSDGGNVVVKALAGTGKTSTAVLVARQERSRRGLYVAFNAAIVAAAKGKFPDDIKVSTVHGLAMASAGRKYRHRLNAGLVPMREAAALVGARGAVIVDQRKLAPTQVARLALETVEEFCKSADPGLTADHVPVPAALGGAASEVRALIVPLARAAWADLTDPAGRLRFDHAHYLKIWQLTSPRLGFDYIIFDEAQDAWPAAADVMRRQSGVQVIPVGDPNQAINEWMGAVDSLAMFDAPHELVLSQSFRFGPAIAAEASKWLQLLGSPLRVRGHEPVPSVITRKPGHADAVLCRSNAGAMGEVVRSITDGNPTALAGGGGELIALATAAADLKAGMPSSHPALLAFSTWQQVIEQVEEDPAGSSLRVLVKLVDQYGPDRLLQILGELREPADATVTVSTVHKAKGLEWDSVRIAEDFPMPHGPGELAEWPAEEMRLAYVAVTRARLKLDPGGLSWVDSCLQVAA